MMLTKNVRERVNLINIATVKIGNNNEQIQ